MVTGASTGIGRATAELLACQGIPVYAGVRRPEDGQRLESEHPGLISGVELDVTSADQIRAAVEKVGAAGEQKGLAGLVNNAGIALGGPLEFVAPDLLRRQLEVNLIGLHSVTTAFLPLIRRGRGRIVNVGSISGLVSSPFVGPYCASKHAVEALTDALRMELAPEGIHVAVIEPGQVRTPIWDKALAASGRMHQAIPPEGEARYEGRLRAFRYMVEKAPRHAIEPERVARAIHHALFAARPRTRYLLGRDARVRYFLSRLLPDRMMDALVTRFFARMERRAQ